MTAKRAAIWGGRLLALVSLVYLGWAAARHWHDLGDWRPTGPAIGLLVVLPVVYGVSLLLIGEAWHQLIGGFAGRSLDRRTAIASYGVTQVAKYLPGNVFHYVGRHLWLSRLGVPHKALALGVAWETVLLAGSAVAVAAAAVFVAAISPPDIAGQPARFWAAIALVAGGCLLAALLALPHRVLRLRAVVPPRSALLRALGAYLVFFSIQGLAFALLFVAVGATPVLLAVGIAGLSWVAGFLTPGAPGGIGSRELVLTTLAAPLVGTAPALILSALFRLVTTLGDVVCFAISKRLAPMPAEAAAS
ncbi:hypothetical protein [Sphingomonas sp.]|uniref:hypothetical protein n=1 Tax=Sphingomonas sp. TaxID=28214 RepID=UPI002DBB557A|nr:hypothetical protein [Sphingomonas sp.]HEU4967620.1 hypothetical protein [Sphingomonas sp.]